MSNVYLGATPLPEARRLFLDSLDLSPLGEETVAVAEAAGRVTSGLVLARLSCPHYHASAMDGFAIVASSTFTASEREPVRLRVLNLPRPAAGEPSSAGERPAVPAKAGDDAPSEATCARVDTGDPLPAGYDAVVPIEDAIPVGDGSSIELRAAVYPWQDVRVQGEDIVAGEVLFGTNHLLDPAGVGLLLAAGVLEVPVWRRPVVTIIPTGDEIVSPMALKRSPGGGEPAGLAPEPGIILETNGTVARLTLESWGCDACLLDPVPDVPARIGRTVDEALAMSDLVLIGAGSSAGRDDYTSRIVAERGKVVVHGVAVRPGKPVILGVVAPERAGVGEDGRTGAVAARPKPVVGLPGYPVSSALALDLYVRPLVYAWQGRPEPQPDRVMARLGRPIPSPLGIDEFVRVKVAKIKDDLEPNGAQPAPASADIGTGTPYVVVPLPRGAGLLSALSQADGVLRVPANREGFGTGEIVPVDLARPRADIDQALLVTGSHDLLLDLLSSRLSAADPALSLSAGRAGSLGGLLALRDGLCHLAGTHLLDEATGDYNGPWVERLMPGRGVMLLTLAWRRQGFMVRPGNPKKIEGLADLVRSDLVYINRQRGSGTRVLLDYLLHRDNIDSGSITGYAREEGSHLGVASAVASGAADVGLGILAAARALGLDFIPVAEERYDLAFLPELADDPRLDLIRRIIRHDEAFRSAAADLGGYDLRDTGKEITVDH